MKGKDISDRLRKFMERRGWIFRKSMGRYLLMERRGRVVILVPIEGRRRVFIDEKLVERALSIRDKLRRDREMADAVIAARIGRRWRFVLLTKSKKIKLDSKSSSNWYP